MGFTNLLSKSVKNLLLVFPHDYSTKVARKVRKELECYGKERSAFTSNKGDIFVSGVRKSLGMKDNIDQFEPETIRWVDQFIKSGDTVWDIGANVGLYSCYISKIKDVRLLAFEPHAATYAELVDNLIVNNTDQNPLIQALNVGLASETKLGNMQIISSEVGFTSSTVLSERQSNPEEIIALQPVTQYRADDLSQIFEITPTHLKIDVDGAEESVLIGAKDILKKAQTLLIEVENELVDKFSAIEKEYILSAGFHACKISDPQSERMRFFSKNPEDIL